MCRCEGCYSIMQRGIFNSLACSVECRVTILKGLQDIELEHFYNQIQTKPRAQMCRTAGFANPAQ